MDVESTLVALGPSGKHICVLLFGDSRVSGIYLLSNRSDGRPVKELGLARADTLGRLGGFVVGVCFGPEERP